MWTVVAQHFPQYFTTLDRRDARRTLIHWMPHEFMTVTGETIDIKDSYQLQEEAFREATKDKWVSISASSRPQGMVEVIATMGGNRWPHKEASKERRFLVPAVEYAGATRLGFVVDPAMHQEVLSDGVQIAARHSQRISHIKSESLSVW